MTNIVNQGQASNANATYSSLTTSSITVTAGHSLAIVIFGYPSAILGATFSDGGIGNTYVLGPLQGVDGNVTSVVFATGPSSGATSGTLSTNWLGSTASNYTLQFSDFEIRGTATLTNGSTAVTWTGALSATVGTAVNAFANDPAAAFFYAQNANAGATAINFSGSVNAIYVAELANVGHSGALTFNQNIQFGPGTGTNVITSGSVATSTASSVLFGFTFTDQAITADAAAGGTGFSAQSPVWAPLGGGTFHAGIAEDSTVSTSTAATFTSSSGAQFGNFTTFGAIFPPPGASAPTVPTPLGGLPRVQMHYR